MNLMNSLLSAKSKHSAKSKSDMKLKAAQRQKYEIEARLKQLESEIFTIKTNISKKNRTKKLIEISDDPLAHESAVNFVKKMNEMRYENRRMPELKEIDNKIALMTEEDSRIESTNQEKKQIKRDLISAKLSEIEKRKEKRKEFDKTSNEIINELLHSSIDDSKIFTDRRAYGTPEDTNSRSKTKVNKSFSSPKLKSILRNKVVANDNYSKHKQKIDLRQKKDMVAKRQEYSKMVKNMYKPKTQQETLERMDKMDSIQEINTHKFLKRGRQAKVNFKKSSNYPKYPHYQPSQVNDKIELNPLSKRYKNYLKDIRPGLGNSKLVVQNEGWKKIITQKGMNEQQKLQSIFSNAEVLEAQAKRKEKLAILKPIDRKDPENNEEINNLYLNTIKSKLALLEKLKAK